MSNGKVQPDKSNDDVVQMGKSSPNAIDPHQLLKNQKRTGRIRLGVQRTLSTARFETIVIHYELDEEITWDDPQERAKKVMNWEAILTKEFKDIHDKVLLELDLSHKRAYFKDNNSEPNTENNLDDLDSLD